MKTLKYIPLLFLLISLNGFSQGDIIIRLDYINLAVLVVDYDTYQYEGGNMAYYTCPDCTNDSLPFAIDYNEPGDFGDIAFKLSPTDDTVFFASIIWMGHGQIYHPDTFTTDSPFTYYEYPVESTPDIQYYHMDGQTLEDENLIAQADSAWNIIDSLEITNYFADYEYSAGIYLYPPAVGAFDPAAAKWIIFLYYNFKVMVSADEFNTGNEQFTLYPNPATKNIQIDYTGPDHQPYYKITNIQGKVMLHGEIDGAGKTVDISSLPDGLYFLMMYDQNGELLGTRKVVKK